MRVSAPSPPIPRRAPTRCTTGLQTSAGYQVSAGFRCFLAPRHLLTSYVRFQEATLGDGTTAAAAAGRRPLLTPSLGVYLAVGLQHTHRLPDLGPELT